MSYVHTQIFHEGTDASKHSPYTPTAMATSLARGQSNTAVARPSQVGPLCRCRHSIQRTAVLSMQHCLLHSRIPQQAFEESAPPPDGPICHQRRSQGRAVSLSVVGPGGAAVPGCVVGPRCMKVVFEHFHDGRHFVDVLVLFKYRIIHANWVCHIYCTVHFTHANHIRTWMHFAVYFLKHKKRVARLRISDMRYSPQLDCSQMQQFGGIRWTHINQFYSKCSNKKGQKYLEILPMACECWCIDQTILFKRLRVILKNSLNCLDLCPYWLYRVPQSAICGKFN